MRSTSKTLHMKSNLLAITLVFFFLIGCNRKEDDKSFIVKLKGNIANIPDGKIYLVGTSDRKHFLDSTDIINGRFEFNSKIKKSDAFRDASFFVKDKTDTIREFLFATNKPFKGNPMFFDHFILEDSVLINGSATDFTSKDFKIKTKMKMIKIDKALQGKQSWVLYNIDLKFPASANETLSFNEIKRTIEKYPYSYYLLSSINEKLTLFDKNQLAVLLSCFDKDIKETDLWKGLNDINLKTVLGNKQVKQFSLLNTQNKRQLLMDEKNKDQVTVLVFWASWCGPCIQEIPSLKKFYTLNKNIKLIAISVDSEKKKWTAALAQYKMPWTQLWVSTPEEQRELFYYFKLTGGIPATIIIDKKGNVMEKFVGNDPNEDLVQKLSTAIKNRI